MPKLSYDETRKGRYIGAGMAAAFGVGVLFNPFGASVNNEIPALDGSIYYSAVSGPQYSGGIENDKRDTWVCLGNSASSWVNASIGSEEGMEMDVYLPPGKVECEKVNASDVSIFVGDHSRNVDVMPSDNTGVNGRKLAEDHVRRLLETHSNVEAMPQRRR